MALGSAGALAVAVVAAGALGSIGDADRSSSEVSSTTPRVAAMPRVTAASDVGIEPAQTLVVTLPARSGDAVTTRQLLVTGFVVGVPAPVRISLQGRRNRVIDGVTVHPTRSSEETRPQRAGRFAVAFDLPNPRPNGEMLVEIALLTPDGQAFDVIWRYVDIAAIAPPDVPPSP